MGGTNPDEHLMTTKFLNFPFLAVLDAMAAKLESVDAKLDAVITKLEKIMATEAEVQAAADQLTADMSALSTAVTNVLTWVQNNPPNPPIPDALLQELQSAHQSAQDSTQILVAGTPGAAA